MNDEDIRELMRVSDALRELSQDCHLWDSNFKVFVRMRSNEDRRRWWQRAKAQAELGVPAMKALLLKVIEIRLTQ